MRCANVVWTRLDVLLRCDFVPAPALFHIKAVLDWDVLRKKVRFSICDSDHTLTQINLGSTTLFLGVPLHV